MAQFLSDQADNTLSVVAICKNEEQDLPGFFENFLPWVNEIVIIDDGSTDDSIAIIQAAGDKVRLIEHPMDSDTGFSGQRNLGIENATADWLIHTDIDERVPPALATEIMSSINNSNLNGLRYRRRNFFLQKPMSGCGLQEWNKPQLARRGKHYFQNRVHEECVIEGGSDATGQLGNFIWHLNDENYRERVEKSVAYCQEQAQRIEKRGVIIQWWHLLLFPLGEFVRKYFLKSGFRDGVRGLIFSLHSSCAMFKASALVWDGQNRVLREELEAELMDQWRDFQAKQKSS
jgi:(heptosyl)LPS beta-1,4-glucosyltransferase